MQLHASSCCFEPTNLAQAVAPLLMIIDSPAATTTKLSITIPIFDATLTSLQQVGESTFAALFLVAFLQAIVAVFQYRSNPAGELIEPPGPTVGVEEPNSSGSSMVMNEKETSEQPKPPFLQRFGDIAMKPQNSTTTTTTTSRYARILNRLNRALFLLLPLATKTASAILTRQWHLLQIGFILGIARVFDYPTAFFERHAKKPTITTPSPTNSTPLHNTMVIGDSLAIGIGSVDIFDANKNQTVDFHLSENPNYQNNNDTNMSPVFPRVLAQQLANYHNHSIHWRSCGVDGGLVSHIQQYCLDVIRQECKNGHAPNMVVLLCGSNDLKQFVATFPFGNYTPKQFRRRLLQLV